jgi:hypothetical protein
MSLLVSRRLQGKPLTPPFGNELSKGKRQNTEMRIFAGIVALRIPVCCEIQLFESSARLEEQKLHKPWRTRSISTRICRKQMNQKRDCSDVDIHFPIWGPETGGCMVRCPPLKLRSFVRCKTLPKRRGLRSAQPQNGIANRNACLFFFLSGLYHKNTNTTSRRVLGLDSVAHVLTERRSNEGSWQYPAAP